MTDKSVLARKLQADYGLSPAETEVTIALSNGADLRAIAAVRDVSILTVRTQIKTVFFKTGTRSQAQLVSLVLRGG
jgi:DNA-binding CsgD family transcriptional regulator